MTKREDTRVIDLLYGEPAAPLGEEGADPALDAELERLGGVLATMRRLEAEEPPPHLDALILARAREAAAAAPEPWSRRLRRLLLSPGPGLAAAAGLAALVAVVIVPTVALRKAQPEIALPAAAPAARGADSAREQAGAAAPPSKELVAEEPAALPFDAAKDLDQRAVGGAKPGRVDSTARGEAFAGKPARAPEAKKEPPARRAEAPADDRPAATKTEAAETDEGGLAQVAPAPAAGAAPATPARPAPPAAASVEPAPAPPAPPPPRERRLEERAKADDSPEPRPAETAASAATEKTARQARPDAPSEPQAAASYAADMIRAARAQLALGDKAGARRILLQARDRTRPYPAFGAVSLELAEVEAAQHGAHQAIRYAREAALTPGFAERGRALDLVERMARQTDSTDDLRWVERERAR